ncbi:MAG TPA: helix-turn-helix transcriptional regulator [Agitococcus sp.]|nr:helix-turn-helix transcriptional regulator [Agitococcus sp.]
MSNFPEIGYTPANLRFLIESKGWTQKQFAEKIGKAERTVRQWLNPDLLSRNHADMPHCLWLIALELE